MSNAPKFKTFRDLRSLPNSPIKAGESPADISRTSERNSTTEVSPVRDFQKVPNSVSRSLDMFRGKSKQVWDYLWSVTRGAVQPTRSTRKSRKEIKDGSGIGSMVTVDAAIEHLTKIGLLKVSRLVGSPGGNEYEIHTPEEVKSTYTSYTSYTSYPTQKLDILDIPLSSITSIGYSVENKGICEDPKTSFKDFKDDDDSALAEFLEILKKVSKKISGEIPKKKQSENWKKLAELLAMELEIAAARTDGVSNVPAFLTEHLRRRFLGKPDSSLQNANQTSNKNPGVKDTSKSLQIGESLTSSDVEYRQFVPESLTEEGKASVLETMRWYINRGEKEFMLSMQEVYTAEDWAWLIANLAIEEPETKKPK